MSRSGSPRLLLLVVGGIVRRIVGGKDHVGLVVVEKFKYIAFVVKVPLLKCNLLIGIRIWEVDEAMMKNRKERIINIVFKVGRDGDVWQVNYRATKGEVITFTEGATKEYSESGINVSSCIFSQIFIV
nr:hypothetical protein [Tanacetum cinerariifolium]GEY64088.1 hypothetical protein [Tanacetum cinerariifolium]GEY73963.1 hypothetical protein [Tanacetum cinerariifolium]